MIDINLLPERLKKKKKKSLVNIPQIPRETLMGLIVGVVVILILLHLLLVGILIMQKIRLTGLNRNWKQIASAKKDVDIIKEEIATIEKNMLFFNRATNQGKRVIWAQKLNQLSDFVPPGVWLTKVSYLNDKFIIEGSAISKRGEEMMMVGKFTTVLKNDTSFVKNFKNIELTSIKRKMIKVVEVADFVITCSLRD